MGLITTTVTSLGRELSDYALKAAIEEAGTIARNSELAERLESHSTDSDCLLGKSDRDHYDHNYITCHKERGRKFVFYNLE